MKKKMVGLICAVAMLGGCSTTPKEVVELSYAMGENLAATHKSYKELARDRFKLMREERLDYLSKEWKPNFVKNWVRKGRLIDVANGDVVWSKIEKKYVEPTSGLAADQQLQSIEMWAHVAIVKMQEKERELLTPLENDEQSLIGSIDEAFNQMYRANASITAHLNSIRKVQEVQDGMLDSLKLKNLQARVGDLISESSRKAKEAMDEIREADQRIENVQDNLQLK